jgi:hypothetical protein
VPYYGARQTLYDICKHCGTIQMIQFFVGYLGEDWEFDDIRSDSDSMLPGAIEISRKIANLKQKE